MILQESLLLDYMKLYIIDQYLASRERRDEIQRLNANISTLDEKALTQEFGVFFTRLCRGLDLALHKPGDEVITQTQAVWVNGELDESSSPKVYFVLDGKYRSCVLMYLQEKRRDAQSRELEVWKERVDAESLGIEYI